MAKVSKKKRSSGGTSPGKPAGAKASNVSGKRTKTGKTTAGKTRKKRKTTAKKNKMEAKMLAPENTIIKDTVTQSLESSADPAASKDIPQFDLNEQMLAGHRRSTSLKRKSPANRPSRTAGDSAASVLPGKDSELESNESRRIIREIVARDIEKLRRPK